MSDPVVVALITAITGVISGLLAIGLQQRAQRKTEELAVTKEQMAEWRALVEAKNIELDRKDKVIQGQNVLIERQAVRITEYEGSGRRRRTPLQPGDG